MTYEELQLQIEALLDQAEPLRCLPDDDPSYRPLPGLIDDINRLRQLQERLTAMIGEGQDAKAESEFAAVAELTKPKRKGRPPRDLGVFA